jgi:hypothetical protein
VDDRKIEVEEDQISEEEWAQLWAIAQKQDHLPPTVSNEKRGKQPAIPENLRLYLSRAQLASIKKLETFGWELFFIRRSDPEEMLTVMYLSRSGETAVIEQDGTINRAHGVDIRAGR